jgi:hypothetical protein
MTHDAALEEALAKAALACSEDIGVLRPMFDALALAPSTPELLEDLRTRFTATLGAQVAAALLDGTHDVAEVARRGERLVQLHALVSR